MKKLKKVLISILSILLIIILIFISNGLIERAFVNRDIKDFINRSVFVTKIGDTNYYKVIANNDEDTSRVFDINDKNYYIGTTGDIILTNRNPLKYSDLLITKSIVGVFSKTMFLGHASLVVTDDGAVIVEITDHINSDNEFIKEEIGVKYSQNTWITDDDGSPYIIGLRVKGIDESIKENLLEFISNNIGKPYNHIFIHQKDKFYCTDLVSRAYNYSGININYDWFFTTGCDLLVSRQTYIIFIREKKIVRGETFYNVYYLSEE